MQRAVRAHVLLIEDHRPTLDAFRQALADVGFDVHGVSDAASALDVLGTRSYDVIIADYRLPVISGLDMLRAIRPAVPRTPIILYSGVLTPEVAAEARRAGAWAILEKPFALDVLIQTVRDAARRRL